MSKKIDDGGLVFTNGISLRDWFAGQAIASALLEDQPHSAMARWAYELADEMIKARKKDYTQAPTLPQAHRNTP